MPVQAFHAHAFAGGGQATGELVNVAGRVAFGEIAAVELARQRGLNHMHFIGCDGAALQSALCQQLRDFARVLKACTVAVDVQDALLFQVEINAFTLSPGEQMLACCNGQACGFDGVFLVLRNGRQKLREPRNLVPAGFGIDQQRCVAFEHPFQPLEDGGPVCPDLGV